ncbi:LLM class flavin-dependent oxidoreductase [Streptomyces sp. NPDC049915]|uniref:LLM class flavin-dependent oxidoreductase n=1 Tax=Streptomyces sp. NPDC049915 TaxID=3155510 RepID=UPI00342C351A
MSRRLHLAVRVDGAGGPGGFPALARPARTAERGLFDFVLVRGRRSPVPEPVTLLDALAAVTAHTGLAATVDVSGVEPFQLVRRLATLDGLSGGRAGWHPVFGGTSYVDTVREVSETDFAVPSSPQGRPVLIVTGECEEQRECAAARADVLVTSYGPVEAGRAVYADVKRRLARYGRRAGELRILADAGPAGGVFDGTATGARRSAAELEAFVREGAADGFLLGSGGLEEFVDRVVPLLQERGAFRTAYEGATLRSHLGLGAPAGKG